VQRVFHAATLHRPHIDISFPEEDLDDAVRAVHADDNLLLPAAA
jgi:hypothetical protein